MRGLCYARLREYARAESDYTRTLELEPTFTPAWFNRGRCRMAQRNAKDAISDFTRGLELSPGEADLLLSRSKAYRQQGMREQADKDFAEAMQTDNLSATSLHSRALVLMDIDAARAVADLQRAHLLDPDRISILTRTARTLSTRLGRTFDRLSDRKLGILIIQRR